MSIKVPRHLESCWHHVTGSNRPLCRNAQSTLYYSFPAAANLRLSNFAVLLALDEFLMAPLFPPSSLASQFGEHKSGEALLSIYKSSRADGAHWGWECAAGDAAYIYFLFAFSLFAPGGSSCDRLVIMFGQQSKPQGCSRRDTLTRCHPGPSFLPTLYFNQPLSLYF